MKDIIISLGLLIIVIVGNILITNSLPRVSEITIDDLFAPIILNLVGCYFICKIFFKDSKMLNEDKKRCGVKNE